MTSILEKYSYFPDPEAISGRLATISAGMKDMATADTFKDCFSFMDLTTLHSDDTVDSVRELVGKVSELSDHFPDYPLPASVCVYPNFASVASCERISSSLHVTAVSGCFPSSQSFLEVKVRECELAVENGADEVDVVLPLNLFLAGDFESARYEICAMRSAVDAAGEKVGRKVILKVIIESGLLGTADNIAAASFLAMESGADFIKTSTGKVSVNATPFAACVMCESISAFHKTTGRMVGFKAAGGISDANDALCYYAVVAAFLGQKWISKEHFRFGVSRLGNSLMSAIEGKTVTFF